MGSSTIHPSKIPRLWWLFPPAFRGKTGRPHSTVPNTSSIGKARQFLPGFQLPTSAVKQMKSQVPSTGLLGSETFVWEKTMNFLELRSSSRRQWAPAAGAAGIRCQRSLASDVFASACVACFLCELGEASRVCGCSPNREGTRTTAWGLSLKSEASEVNAVLSQGITAVFSSSFSTLRTLRTANETEMIRNHVARSPNSLGRRRGSRMKRGLQRREQRNNGFGFKALGQQPPFDKRNNRFYARCGAKKVVLRTPSCPYQKQAPHVTFY